MAIPVLELMIRGIAAGAFVLLALCIGLAGRAPARLAGTLFCLAAAAHTFTQSQPAFDALGLVAPPVWILSVAGAGLLWAFALELFGDNVRLSPWRFLPAGLLLATGAAAEVSQPSLARGLWLIHNLGGAVLMLHVLAVIWSGWRGDLVETRRRLRGPVLGLAAVYALVVAGVESAELFALPTGDLLLLAALSLFAMSLLGGAVFLRPEPQLFGPAARRPAPRGVEAPDQYLLGRLSEALDVQELWRQEGLTIGALAAKIGVPEHQLRRLINEGLGYRNFTAFINERRIGAAKALLADPGKLRVTVATVAYEVGFSSLGPFNRAFRGVTGQTPTAWRRTALGEGAVSDTAA